MKRLAKYLFATFAISWGAWWALALLIYLKVLTFTHPAGILLFMIGGFGPTIAALLVLSEKLTAKSILAFIFSRRRKTIGILLLFCILITAVIGFSSLETNPTIPVYVLPAVLAMTTLVGGGNEELGWRGIMQPQLEQALPFPAATVITGIVWAVWHLPLWFVEGSSQQNMPFMLFAINAVLLSFWLAAIYKHSHCVFDCCVFHGLNNTLMSFFVIKVNWQLIAGFLVMLVPAFFLWYTAPQEAAASSEL